MDDLMAALFSGPDADTRAMGAYRMRLMDATGRYLDEGWQAEIAEWLRPLAGREAMEEGASRLAAQRDAGLALAAWADGMIAALRQAARREEEEEDAG